MIRCRAPQRSAESAVAAYAARRAAPWHASPRLVAQRRAIAGSFGNSLQRLRIPVLELDTKRCDGQTLVDALGRLETPFTDCLGDFEARALLNRFDELEFAIPEQLREQLQACADFWQHDSDEDDTSDKGKQDLAAEITRLLGDVLPLMLSGGGAVALRGGKRAIKDLDFRTELPETTSFCSDNEAGAALIERINTVLARGHHIDPLEVSDAATGFTIKGMVDSVEVSITRTPKVSYAEPEDIGGVQVLSRLDLLWDKAYAFIFRSEAEKRISDLYDLAVILVQDGKEGRRYAQAIKYGLGPARGQAYQGQAEQRRKREQQIEERPVKELGYKLAEVFENQQLLKQLKQAFAGWQSDKLVAPLSMLNRMLG